MTVAPLVELHAVTKRYRNLVALSEVSFDLRPGEVFGYIGPNGAGKTTTLKILAGLLLKFEGTVCIAGHRMPERRDDVHQRIGFLPQSAGFQHWRTVDSILRSLGLLSGVAERELEERIAFWLDRFDLSAKRHEKIKKLSGGMIQKIALIQALLHKPELLILDEPLAGLDPLSRTKVKRVIRECRTQGSTVLFSSHILSDVQDVADRVGILDGGRLRTSASIAELKAEVPVRIAIEFSTLPGDLSFLNGEKMAGKAVPTGPNAWTVRLVEGADADEAIHHLVTQTLDRQGRLRRVGTVDPDLDHLYAQYIEGGREVHG